MAEPARVAAPPPHPSKLRRWGGRALAALALTVVFVCALFASTVIHLGLPGPRRVAATLTARLLSETFQGSAEIDGIAKLGPGGLVATGLRMRDPDGRTVLDVHMLEARFSAWEAARRFVFGGARLDLVIDHVRLDDASALVVPDAQGTPTIARAFAPRVVETEAEAAGKKPSRMRIWLPTIEIGKLSARGKLGQGPLLETTVREARASLLVAPTGVAIDVERFGMVLRGVAGVDVAGIGSFHLRSPGRLWAYFDGDFGQIPTHLFASLDGKKVEARVDLPRIEPAAMRAVLESWPVRSVASLTARARGEYPHIEAEATVLIANGSLHAQGPISLQDGVDVDLDVDAAALDLSAIDPKLPSTSLSARSALLLWTDGATLEAEANAAVAPSEIAGITVPAIDLRAEYGERGLEARATLHERGVPARLTVRMPPSGETVVLAELKKTRLENSPRLSRLLGATGTVEGDLEATLRSGAATGRLTLSTSNLHWNDITLGDAKLVATARGPTDTPEHLTIDASLDSKKVSLGPLSLATLKAKVEGPATKPRVKLSALHEDGTAIEAAVAVTPATSTLEDGSFAVSRPGAELSGKLERASFGGGQVELAGLVLESGGRLTANATIGTRHAKVQAQGKNIDLDRIARALSLPGTRLSGKLDVDANVTLGEHSQGTAHLVLQDASLWTVSDVNLDAQAKFDDRATQGTLTGGITGLGSVSALWNLTLDGNALDAGPWTRATGQAQMARERLDLELLARLFGARFGVERAGGTGYVRVSLARQDKGQLPHALFLAGTENLSLDVKREGDEPLEIEFVDVSLAGAMNGATGKVEATARLFDFRGDIATVSAEVPTQLDVLVPAALAGKPIWPHVADQPVRAVLLVPNRNIEQLPTFVRPENVDGRVNARAVLTGTLASPELNVAISARNLAGSATPLALPVGVDAALRYAKNTGKLEGSVQVSQNRQRIAWGTFDLVVPFEHFAGEVDAKTALWTGKLQLLLDGAPLAVATPLAERKVGGSVQGSIALTRTKLLPELRADLTLRHLEVADTSIGEGRVVAESTEEDVIARAHFEDEFGTLTASAQTKLVATTQAFELAESSPLHLTLEINKYDAVVLSPFVRSVLSEISGSLEGTLRATLTPAPKRASVSKAAPSGAPEDAWGARFEGSIRLSGGVLLPSALGMRLRDTNLFIEAGREGDQNVVRLNDIEARAESKEPNFHGRGTLWFDDLTLVRGEFEIDENKVPFSAGGKHMADLTGKANAQLELAGDVMKLNVEVPKMLAELPQTSQRAVIELEDNPNVTIVQPLGPPREEESESGPTTPWVIGVELGDEVRVRSRLMDIQLRGEPEIHLGGETRMSGYVELVPGGNIDVLGRTFFIDQGRVQFDTGDPGNPHLDVSATWRAPNGTIVRAIVRGTAEKPQLNWESDPALPGGEQAIVALVLGTGGGETAGEASGAGIAYGAAIVNELLGQTGIKNVEIYASREGASQGQVASLSERTWDSYTAAYRVSDELWFEGSFKQESTTLDTETRSGVSGALDWRFKRNWSLRTEVGTLGGGVDLLWQHSY